MAKREVAMMGLEAGVKALVGLQRSDAGRRQAALDDRSRGCSPKFEMY